MIRASITVDAAEPIGQLRPIYRFFGADEPNYAYLPDGRRLLGEIGRLGPAQAYFRTHNLMVTGDGTPALKWGSTNMYTEDAGGNPVHDWSIVDRIFDAYLAAGVKPYVQIGFMPKALSSHPEPYQHRWRPGHPYRDIFTGWSYPPKDYHRWRELVYQWVRHCVARYGRAEVEQWYWQVWNEANLADGYWRGSPEEFRKLHDFAIDGVRRALPSARVGGPDTAGPGGAWMREFLDHALHGTNHATGQPGTPLDFVSFHAKGSPTVVDGQVRMGIAHQLRDVDEGLAIIASYPRLRSVPVVIGECDPDGCAACPAEVYPQNGYRNTELYASYTAASFARVHELADRHGVSLEGALTWAFEFEDQPIFAGFRALATTGGITLPVFNVFRMFGRMSGQRLRVTSTGEVPLDELLVHGVRAAPDIAALAAIDADRLSILVWHYHDDDRPGPDAAVTCTIRNLPVRSGEVSMTEHRVDARHSNAYTAWRELGSPPRPTAEQHARLRQAGQLQAVGPPRPLLVRDGTATVTLRLPRQSVSLLVFTDMDLPKIAAPAQRALAAIGVRTLDELARQPEREIAALHGMGPKALAVLKEALHERGLAFSGERPADPKILDLLAPFSPEVRRLALAVRALVRETVPDAVEELDPSAKLIGFTFQPGTYKGLIVAVAPHRSHVNLMFSKGVELLELDTSGLLEGTGKRARHIRFADSERLTDPAVRMLLRAAARRTPRA